MSLATSSTRPEAPRLRRNSARLPSPGVRSQYSPDYYGAFVFDPDGNKIEAVVEH
jgi:hypothetical protein